MEFNVPPECCSTEAEIWQRVSEFLKAGWTGFVLESDRQSDPSSMRVRATKLARQDASASVAQDGGDAVRDCTPSAAVERPTKRPRISDEQYMASVEPASANVSESETAQEGPIDSAANAHKLAEPTLSLRICVDKPVGATGSAGAGGATAASTMVDFPSDDRSLSVRVEFLTGSASSRSEFWKLAETLKADVLRNNRRWRRQAKLAAMAATPVAGSEPKPVSIEGKV